MFRSLRVFVVAAIIAVSLAAAGSDASANTLTVKCASTNLPACQLGIT